MAKVLTDPQHYTAIANAIRAKTGGSETYTSAQMAGAIEAIQTGFGGKLQDKTVTPTSEQQTITADEGYDGLGQVTVEAAQGLVLTENMGIYYKGKPTSEMNLDVLNFSSTAREFILPYTYACYEPSTTNNTATSLAGTIAVKAGDWILATVSTRSDTTYPDGWEVLYQSGLIGSNQRMAMLCKQISADETVSFEVSQTEDARIYINLMAIPGINGFAYHGDSYETTEEISEYTMTRPNYDCVIWACTASFWSTTFPYPTWYCDGLDYHVSLGTATQARQANFWDDGSAEKRKFIPAVSTTMAIACVEVLKEV